MKEREVSIRVLAQATGVPSSPLSEWTAGRDPKLGEPVVKLARFFGVSLEYLVTGKEPEQEIIGNFLEGAEDGFFTIHQGVYRVHVEKFICLILSSACSTAKIEKAWSDHKSSEDFQKEKALFKERLGGKAPYL